MVLWWKFPNVTHVSNVHTVVGMDHTLPSLTGFMVEAWA